MADPLFDKHGILVNDPSDGYHTNTEVNGFVDAILSVPPAERSEYFQAVRPHWDHIHFGGGGDMQFLTVARDGTFKVSTLPFDYSSILPFPEWLSG